jgi:single-strand DNA-binding protein
MLIGNVGRSPELKHTPSGIPVTSFRLATSETWKDRDLKVQEHTDWHTIVAWRGLAEVITKLVTKGSRIYIEGRIQTRTFEDKQHNKRHVVEILAENMLLLDNKKSKDNDFHDDNDSYNDDYDYSDNYDDNSFNDKYQDNTDSNKSKDIPF